MENSVFGGIVETINPHYDPKKAILPLGYFFRTSWPSPSDIGKRDAKSAVLLNPTVNHVEKNYPVPAHLFEDYHQQEFWDVGVRKFGTRILAMRSLQQCGHHERFDPERLQSVSEELVLDEQNPIGRSKLLMLGILERLGPAARSGFEFGRRLYEIASSGRRDLLLRQERREQMEAVQRGIQDLHDATDPQNYRFVMTVGERDRFLPTQVRFLQLAAMKHEHIVDDLHALQEQINNDRDPYGERRKTLLNFNRQVRIYSRRLLQLLCSRGHAFLGKSLKPVEFQLELSFMRLWYDPSSVWCGTWEDSEEYAAMEQVARSLENNDAQLLHHLQRLADLAGVCWVCLAIIKICHASPRVGVSSEASRQSEVKSGLGDLEYIRNNAPNGYLQPWWRDYIDGWLDKGRQLEAKLLDDAAALADDEDGEDVEMT